MLLSSQVKGNNLIFRLACNLTNYLSSYTDLKSCRTPFYHLLEFVDLPAYLSWHWYEYKLFCSLSSLPHILDFLRSIAFSLLYIVFMVSLHFFGRWSSGYSYSISSFSNLFNAVLLIARNLSFSRYSFLELISSPNFLSVK